MYICGFNVEGIAKTTFGIFNRIFGRINLDSIRIQAVPNEQPFNASQSRFPPRSNSFSRLTTDRDHIPRH